MKDTFGRSKLTAAKLRLFFIYLERVDVVAESWMFFFKLLLLRNNTLWPYYKNKLYSAQMLPECCESKLEAKQLHSFFL